MPYWNADLDGCDFAFDSVGVIIFRTVEQLEAEADLVMQKRFPEQSMLALLRILDVLTDEYPKCASVHFGKRRYMAVKEKYLAWRQTCARVPKEHTAEFDEKAKLLFDRLDRKLKLGPLNPAPCDKDATEQ